MNVSPGGVQPTFRKRALKLILLGMMGLVVGCTQAISEPMRSRINTPFTPDISINEVMVGQIDHAAQFIWNAANPDLNPINRDWQDVEHHAIQLIASRAAMTMGGTGVNDAMWIAQPTWRRFVQEMNDASVLALTSARSRNLDSLQLAGDRLVESCEGCHQQYKPGIPTGGYFRSRSRPSVTN